MIVQKSFPVVVLALLAGTAYFQASAATRLLAERWLGPDNPLEPRTRVAATPRPALDARAVMARNPFDSSTGPLYAKQVELDDPLRARLRRHRALDRERGARPHELAGHVARRGPEPRR